MKKLSIAFLLFSACYIMPSCNGDTKTADTTSTSDSSGTTVTNNNMSDTSGNTPGKNADSSTVSMNKTDTLDKDATTFVMKAASGGMMEVELGNVALQQAKSQRVKDFGSMMVTDHTKANDELKALASSKNVTVPAALMPGEQKNVDMLKKKTGADFDKAYISMMLDDHKKDIAEFKKTADKSTSTDLKNFAAKTLPVLQKHLDSVQAIHSSKM